MKTQVKRGRFEDISVSEQILFHTKTIIGKGKGRGYRYSSNLNKIKLQTNTTKNVKQDLIEIAPFSGESISARSAWQ